MRACAALLLCLLLLLAADPVLAAQRERRVALVIGNSAYARFPSLPNPRNDAEDVTAALKRAGFEVLGGTDLTREAIRDQLRLFARAAQGAEAALAYYAGHGLQYKGRNYIVPVDAKLQDEFDLEYETVRIDDIVGELGRADGARILVLDACRNLPLKEKSERNPFTETGLAKISGRGLVVAYATQANALAYDGTSRNSIFTSAFLRAMDEPGLDLPQFFQRVSIAVDKQSDGRQTPELSLSYPGQFFLNRSETDRDVWRRIRDATDPAVFRDFLQKFPGSDLADAANSRLARLDDWSVLKQEQARRAEAARAKREEQERAEETRQRKLAEEKAAEAQRLAEQARAAEEARQRKVAEERAAEAQRLAEQARAAEETRQRKIAEERAAEAQRLAEQARAAEDARQRKLAEKAAEVQRLAEQARTVEEARQRKVAEEKAAEARRLAEQARTAEEARQRTLAEERAAEAQRLAEQARTAEEARQRKVAEERAAEAQRLVEQERAVDEARQIELVRAAPPAEPSTPLGPFAALGDNASRAEDGTAARTTGLGDSRMAYNEAQAPLPEAAPPASAFPADTLIRDRLNREVEAELGRIGCLDEGADAGWTARSRAALAAFAKRAKLTPIPAEPTPDLLTDLKGRPAHFCPLECGPGTTARGDACVAIEKPASQPVARKPEARPEPPVETRRPRPHREAARPRPEPREPVQERPKPRREAVQPKPAPVAAAPRPAPAPPQAPVSTAARPMQRPLMGVGF